MVAPFVDFIREINRECCTKCHSRTFEANVLRLCTKDEMQGAEDEAEGSVLTYVT